MKAIIWGYKYWDLRNGWYTQLGWLVKALQANGVEVCLHNKLVVKDLPVLPKWNGKDECDICIYNHTDVSHIIGNVIPVKRNWFFKPTVPDQFHTTLDELGYGPFSSITYKKPDFESIPDAEVEQFFATKVKNWIDTRETKWGHEFFKATDVTIPYKDYYLVLGQCSGDEVVTRHDFGNYVTKLEQVIKELARLDPSRDIVVKLHPYMDGEHAKDTKYSVSIKKLLEAISPKVRLYMGKSNVHNFIKGARCVILANSGAGFEAMMHHKPIITWGFPEYHWTTYDLRHLASLIQAIKLDWFDAKKQDQFLYWYMERYTFYNQETANNRVKELLNGSN